MDIGVLKLKLVRSLMVVVNYEDIDTSKISFDKVRTRQNGSKYATLTYDSDKLFVKYPCLVTPFGIKSNEFSGQFSGYALTVSLPREGPLLEKAKEVDGFMIEQCVANCVEWGLGGTSKISIPNVVASGYDKNGKSGKYKRMLRYPMKDDKDLDYPPNITFNVRHTERKDFNCKFFDRFAESLGKMGPDNNVVTPFSKVSVLAQWAYMSIGSYGASLKPIAIQVLVQPNDNEGFWDECVFESSEQDSEEMCVNTKNNTTYAEALCQEALAYP